MKNIFENAYFGKTYITRNGRKALYYKGVFDRPREGANHVTLLLEPNEEMYEGFLSYKLDGTAQDGHTHFDIVSELQEQIDEEKLDKLAEDSNPNRKHPNDNYECGLYFGFDDGFKAGYREAIQK